MKPSANRSLSFFLFAAALGGPCSAQSANQGDIAAAVSPCAAYGAGFVPVLGSSTCIHVSGHVRVEMERGRPMRFDRQSPLDTPQASWSDPIFPPRVEGAIPTGFRYEGDGRAP